MPASNFPAADELRPATFRGVGFSVVGADVSVGRRTVLHEYPQRDTPATQDLGRAAREWTVEGFVVGADYVARVDALLTALESPGPGKLVHPWHGEQMVVLKEKARVRYEMALRVATVTMQFVEAGVALYPEANASTPQRARMAAAAVESAAVGSFAAKFSVRGKPDWVRAAATGDLGQMLGLVSTSQVGRVLGLADGIASTLSTAAGMLSSPATLGWSVVGALGLSGLAGTVAAWRHVARAIAQLPGGWSGGSSGSMVGSTAERQAAQSNSAAVWALGRQVLLAQAVGASSLAGTAVDVAGAGLTVGVAGASGGLAITTADMLAVRAGVLSAIAAELALGPDDAVAAALQDAAAAVRADLTARAKTAVQLVQLTPPGTMPALALAHELYADPLRADELVVRNRIARPLHVPGGQVLMVAAQ